MDEVLITCRVNGLKPRESRTIQRLACRRVQTRNEAVFGQNNRPRKFLPPEKKKQ